MRQESGKGCRRPSSLTMKTIGAEHIKDLCTGAAFLATGGGGTPMFRNYWPKGYASVGPAELISPGDLRDDAFVVSIGMVGHPR